MHPDRTAHAPATLLTTIPTPAQTVVLTTVPATRVPLPIMTAPALSLPVSIKDTQLLFTLSAPDGYSGTTIRVPTSDYNILYKTTLFSQAQAGPTVPSSTTGTCIPLSPTR